MEFDAKFEIKLFQLIEKYGKKQFSIYNNADEDDEDFDPRSLTHYFHCDKRKDDVITLDQNFQIKKEKKKDHQYTIIFFDTNISDNLKAINSNGSDDLYKEIPEIDVENLCYYINDLRSAYKKPEFNNEYVKRILDFVEELFKDTFTKIDNMVSEGLINFSSLWYYFDKCDTIYKIPYLNEEICFKYKYFSMSSTAKLEEVLLLCGHIIIPYKKELHLYELTYQINSFIGTKKISSIKISELSSTDKDTFLNYGHSINNIYKTINHKELRGSQYIKLSQENNTLFPRTRNERVIVDYEGLELYSEPLFNFSLEGQLSSLNDEDKIIIFPFVSIYNLGINKDWGIAHIKNLHNITYNDKAYDSLVLESDKKMLIKSLIDNKTKTSQLNDFIDNKGHGLVFLLYGPPGLGKSLTVEAIAEYMKRPLYSINCGDLGIDPSSLEEMMNMILVYAQRWNCLILIDEVDIFVEERVATDITRNAMVGIFLKLLEYHNGIIFLTTNRLNSIDSAIKSRINLMLSYKALTDDKRLQIWKKLCSHWNINLSDKALQELSLYNINGREIRNYIKLVVAIHESNNIEISSKSFLKKIKKCFKITEEFDSSIGKHNNTLYV